MKKSLIIGACCTMLLSGCAGSKSIIKEFDVEGNIIKETTTNTSVIEHVIEGTKNKNVIIWESGWMAYISCSTATLEDPTPTVKMFAGKADKGYISLHKDNQTDLNNVAEIINATKQDLQISKDGINSVEQSNNQ